MKSPSRKKIVIYSHDTYGLGHLRRNLLLAGRLVDIPEAPSVLLITGSPRTQAFALPQCCDTIKLPAVIKQSAGGYRARSLPMTLEGVRRLRTDIIRATVRSFDPDLILVDHSPAGMQGELHPLFIDLSRRDRKPKVVLGLRDVIDEPDRVREEWTSGNVWSLLDGVYDRILIYGNRAVVSTVVDLGLEERFPDKITHVGYLGRRLSSKEVESDEPVLLVMTGGGGDGDALLSTFASFLESLSGTAPFRSVIVTGPFLARRRRRALRAKLDATGQPVEIIRFTDRIEHLMTSATGVISMAGYNSVVEILSAGVPALLVPREWPRREQRIRAESLERVSHLECCPVGDFEPCKIADFVHRMLGGETKPWLSPDLTLDGLDRSAEEIRSILRDEEGGMTRPGDRPERVSKDVRCVM